MTEQQVRCPRCGRENPPSNPLCGPCGAPLAGGEQLVASRQERGLAPAGRAWPAKLGPAGKMLAVGLAALAAEAGVSWLRRRIGAQDRGSASRDADPAVLGHLVSQSLEEVLVQRWGDSHSRVVTRREVRSVVTTWPTGRRR